MTYQECVKAAGQKLVSAGIENGMQEAWYLLEHVSQMDRVTYLSCMQEPMPMEDAVRYEEVLNRRCTHYPLQYLTGVQEFMGLPFLVNEHVLIPRQDTETLVEEILSRAKEVHTILDVCTGSGCIAVSLAKLLPGSQVTALDLSEQALRVAEENNRRMGTEVTFIHSDLFQKIAGQYNLIVSNPPYIPTEVLHTLMPEVKDYEPEMALDGKADGLYFYRKMIEEAREFITPGGWLFFEIGYDQGESVSSLFRQFEEYTGIQVIKDLAGLDRIVLARYEVID